MLALAGLALARARPRRGTAQACAWLALVAATAFLAGLQAGAARLDALDARAFTPAPGAELRLRGFVAGPPRTGATSTRFPLETATGRIGVEAGSDARALAQGGAVEVTGTIAPVADWQQALWARQGVTRLVRAESVDAIPGRRDGLAGTLDAVRDRARGALGAGTGEASAALLRGFVLGEDDRIPEPVREQFRRSGLAHVLAVSGQNVMLLALLALPLLGLLGLSLRTRLAVVIALIAIYVPVAGAGPSIQRAGVMGVAGIAALLAGRPRSGWYALLLAAVITLALDPRAWTDIGWQLSFAAVAGLFLLARPLAAALAGPAGRPGAARRALAEGAAITTAATAATGPLVAHHFGVVSLTALPANLLALPAIAPAMWLGMLAGALGQIPGAPVEPLSALGGLCAAFVGWCAALLGAPWAQLEVPPPGPAATALWTAACAVAVLLAARTVRRRQGLLPRRTPRGRRLLVAALALTLATAAPLIRAPAGRSPAHPPALELRFLDVGQGDAILLRPRGGDPLLVDAGPPGDAVATRLEELGVERLAALVVTHDQLDHSGGLGALSARLAVDRLVTGPGPAPLACRRHLHCPPRARVVAGDVVRLPGLRLEVLWPPSAAGHGDPNAGSLVLRVRRRGFQALLTGDAEAEATGYVPGPFDVLKVSHHGSADSGLPGLLREGAPALAVISVGEGNPYGHPHPTTLAALATSGAAVRRTDRDGEIVVAVGNDGWTVE